MKRAASPASHARARQLDYGRALAHSLAAQSGNGPAQSCSLWIRKEVNLRSRPGAVIWLTENYVDMRQYVMCVVEFWRICLYAHSQNVADIKIFSAYFLILGYKITTLNKQMPYFGNAY